MNENEIACKVIGISIDLRKNPGAGLLESTYKECLAYELIQSGFFIRH